MPKKHKYSRVIIIDALRDGLALMIGLTAVIMVFVFAAKNVGLNFVETMLLSCTVIAGASMITAVQLIAAGAGIWQILISTFLINLRFLIFSAAVTPHLKKRTFFHGIVFAFPMMTAHVGLIPSRAKAGKPCEEYTIVLNYIIVASTAFLTAFWFLITTTVPAFLLLPISFALPAAFISFIVSMVRGNAKWGTIVVLISGMGTLCLNAIIGNWAFMAAGLAVAAIGAALER